jgi:hypothetical protein
MAFITIPDKSTGDALTATEFNQILDALKDGTLDINASGLYISGNPLSDTFMAKATYDPAAIGEQVVGLTASQALTNKSVNGVTLQTGGSTSEFLNKNGVYSSPSGSGTIGYDVYNAKVDYSAVGDGVTDDTTALQNALNAAAGVKPLYLPPGTYMVDPLYISSDTTFFGAGMGLTTIKLKSGQTWGTAFQYNAVLTNETILPSDFGGTGARDEHIYIYDMTIDGNKAGQSGTNSEAECLSFYGVQDCYIDRLELINAYASGYDIDYCDRVGAGFLLVKDSRLTGIHCSVGSPQGVNEGNDNCWIDVAIILNSGTSAFTDQYYGGTGTGIGDGKGYYNHFGYIYADTCTNETAFKAVTLGGISCKLDHLALSNVTGDGLEINNQSVISYSNYNTVGKATFDTISGTDWQIDGGTGYFWENDISSGGASGGLVDLSTGLIESWDLNETSGTRAGLLGSVPLTDNNTVGSTTGLEGNAARFVASSSEYLSASSSALLNTFKAASFWVRFTTISGTGVENGMIGKDATGLTEGDWSVVISSGKIVFAVQGTSPITCTSTTTPVINTWYHVVCSYDGTSGYLYIDGELESTSTGTLDASSNSNTFTLGARQTDNYYLDGDLDMVQIWSRHINIYTARALKTLGLQ